MPAPKIDLKTAPMSVLRAIALSAARDIDRGEDKDGSLRALLEDVFRHIPTASEERAR
jgi:hypothetical protein